MIKTQWFVYEVPAYVGVYERDMSSAYTWDRELIYSYWNGCTWEQSDDLIGECLYKEGAESGYQHLPWRGIVQGNM